MNKGNFVLAYQLLTPSEILAVVYTPIPGKVFIPNENNNLTDIRIFIHKSTQLVIYFHMNLYNKY